MNNSRNFTQSQAGLFLLLGTIIPIAVVSILTSDTSLAQIIPDTTLENESSRVTTGVNIKEHGADLIEGGAQRGSSLFHSFAEFNVNNGQRVYFANPTGIANIFSRVTGGNASNILGTLGVNGAANLFLLNPKGIIFGPNAQLDIQGSFLATTANSFKFPDGSEFSATNPQAPPLLTMSVPVGVQYGSQQTASITNEGNLVTGKNLTLSAENLDLQGTLQAGGDLILQAQDTLTVRDSASNPFIAAAGGNLLAQGNQEVDIFALNNPNSGFFSGGDMVLQSENTVGGDAHYWAGGNFRIEQLNGNLGNLFSPYHPVIRASGDVSFGSYKGVSLHIFAGGSVNIDGDVKITGVDSTSNSIKETVTLSDGKTDINIDGSATPTLDIRAGVNSNDIGTPGSTPNPPIKFDGQNLNPTNKPTNANININGKITNPGGLIFLTNQYQPNFQLLGDITTKEIDSGRHPSLKYDDNGGNIVIQSKGHITTAQIFSGIDNNIIGAENAGNAGNIIIQGSGNITIRSTKLQEKNNAGAINASVITYKDGKYNAGNSGKIQITSTNGDIKVTGGIFTNSTASGAESSAGDTGDITLQARQGTVEVTGNDAGVIVTRTKNDATVGQTGNAGNITIDARTIKIKGRNNTEDLDITSESKLTGSSGKITFTSQTPLELEKLTIGSDAKDGKGGDIEIIAPSLTLTNSQISTKTSGAGNAGNIKIITPGAVLLDKKSEINTSNTDNQGNTGSGIAGSIKINASDQVSIFNDSKISSVGKNGWIFIGNSYQPKTFIIDKSVINTNNEGSGYAGNISINARDQVSILNGSNISSKGWLGIIDITTGSLSLNQKSQINTDSNSSQLAGNIVINASNKLSILNDSNISSKGNNGYIDITTGSLSLNQNSEINTDNNNGSAKAGNIVIHPSAQVSILNNSNISSKGNNGDIDISTRSLSLNQNSGINTTNNSGNAGNIKITTNNLLLRRNSRISTTAGTEKTPGNGGTITIDAKDGFVVADPTENSDIIANAFGGQGGKIKITANRVLGFQNRGKLTSADLNAIEKNGISDISASSDVVGADGEVAIETLSIDPSQGLVALPTTLVDPSRLIAQGCGSSNSSVAKGQSEFVITGRGGLPPSPDDTLKAGAILPEWVVNNTVKHSNNSANMTVKEMNLRQLSSNTSAPLVEAVGMVRSANGDIILTTQPTTATLLQSGLSTKVCGAVQGNIRE